MRLGGELAFRANALDERVEPMQAELASRLGENRLVVDVHIRWAAVRQQYEGRGVPLRPARWAVGDAIAVGSPDARGDPRTLGQPQNPAPRQALRRHGA